MPWVPKTSRSTGKTYYFNTETKETTWKRPSGVVVSGQEKTKKKVTASAIVRRLDDDDDGTATMSIAEGYGKVARDAGDRNGTRQVGAWNNKVKRLLLERYRLSGMAYKVLDLGLRARRGHGQDPS